MSLTDDEMLEVFVQESTEHLDTLEPDLLSLEDAPDDDEVINRIFRSVHSIKGTSGFFGLTNISHLAHRMENLMSHARDKTITLEPSMVEAILKGTDKLRIMIDNPENSPEVDTQAEMDTLQTILEKIEGPTKKPQSGTSPETPENADTAPEAQQLPEGIFPDYLNGFTLDPKAIEQAQAEDNRLYHLKLYTKKDLAQQSQSPLDFFKEIESLGTFLDSTTNFGNIQGLDSALDTEIYFEFLFAAPMEKQLVANICGIPEEQLTEINPETANAISLLSEPRKPVFRTERTAPSEATKAKQKNSEIQPAAPKPAVPPPTQKKEPKPATTAKAPRKKADETIRVPVSLLDDLMTLAGEMVLGRNQLVRLAGKTENKTEGLNSVLQNINVVTSDMQEKVMKTRLQPIGTILGKFQRIARDLARNLGKEIHLETQGEDVELDRSILEAISDPLVHIIRNCADHGIEMPDVREKAGKARQGTVHLSASHAGGQVHVEIVDDGKGIDPAIMREKAIEKGLMSSEQAHSISDNEATAIVFMPGFSSAEQVSDVSGRGVGMDVVRTNIEKLGGSVEIDSRPGIGTRLCLKLPLTLAIIPAMIIEGCGRRFAVPQVDLEEAVRVDQNNPVEMLRGTPVLRLRGKLLPLVDLADVLENPPEEDPIARKRHILILKAGAHRFGLIVDDLLNIEEIVVKPLSKYLQSTKCYSGATIMGDGQVAMILDVSGLVQIAAMRFNDVREEATELSERQKIKQEEEKQSILLFNNAEVETFAINLDQVSRIEKIATKDIQNIGGKHYYTYRDKSLRLIFLHEFMPVSEPTEIPEYLNVIIPKLVSLPMGIVATRVKDAVQVAITLDKDNLHGTGILGSTVINKQMAIMLDIYSLFEAVDPDHYSWLKSGSILRGKRVLLAEDSAFFRSIELQYLNEFHCDIDVANNGYEAWDLLAENRYDLLLTDIEMPGMNGFELAERVRGSENHKKLPIIALTALSDEKSRERGRQVGIDAYETKLNKERLRQTIEKLLSGKAPRDLPGEGAIIDVETLTNT